MQPSLDCLTACFEAMAKMAALAPPGNASTGTSDAAAPPTRYEWVNSKFFEDKPALRRAAFSRWRASGSVAAATPCKYRRSPAHTPWGVTRFFEMSLMATAVISIGVAVGILTVPTTTLAGALAGTNSA